MTFLNRPKISIGALLALAFVFAHTPTVLAQNKHVLPLFISASHQTLQGFVRIINLSERDGTVTIHAIDDSGNRSDPVTLSLSDRATRHFNSDDLKDGNPDKGLSRGVGSGQGNWRLELDTDLDIDPLAYTRPRGDGFLTSTHDVVAQDEPMRWRVPVFNPGDNAEQHSWLRVVNTSGVDAEVVVRGLDDRSAPPPGGEVSFTLSANAARMLSAMALEEGSSEDGFEFDGSFGDGSGKWQLFVSADQPILVMSLLLSESGNLTNLSTSSALPTPTPTPNPAEQRMVPVSVDGQTIRLVVRVFRPDGNGPFPTLSFHHGSTGYGSARRRSVGCGIGLCQGYGRGDREYGDQEGREDGTHGMLSWGCCPRRKWRRAIATPRRACDMVLPIRRGSGSYPPPRLMAVVFGR